MSKMKEFAVQFSPDGALDLETLVIAGEALKNGAGKQNGANGTAPKRPTYLDNPLVPSMLFPATKVREVLVFEQMARVFWREGNHSEHLVKDEDRLLIYCRNKGIRCDDRRPKTKKEDGLIEDVKNIPPAGEVLPRPKEDFIDAVELLESAKNIVKTKPVWSYNEKLTLFQDSKSVIWLERGTQFNNTIYLMVMRRTDQQMWSIPVALIQTDNTWLWLNEVAVDWPRLYSLMAEHVRPAYDAKAYRSIKVNGEDVKITKAMADLFASLK